MSNENTPEGIWCFCVMDGDHAPAKQELSGNIGITHEQSLEKITVNDGKRTTKLSKCLAICKHSETEHLDA